MTTKPIPPALAHIMLRITPDGAVYNTAGHLLCRLEPGELVKLNNAGGEYTIIVHRNVGKKPAKILKLSQGEKP